MSKKHCKDIANALLSIKRDISEGKTYHYGICFEVESLLPWEAFYYWTKTNNSAFSSWEKCSSDISYPVPSPDEKMTAFECYHINDGSKKWTGEYGKLRLELLDHLIKLYSN